MICRRLMHCSGGIRCICLCISLEVLAVLEIPKGPKREGKCISR